MPHSMSDASCSLTLCRFCYQFLKVSSFNFERPVNSICSSGHQLYPLGCKPVRRQCQKCNRERTCVMQCLNEGLTFCMECYPSGFKGCDPFGHQYHADDQSQAVCAICDKDGKGMHGCEECGIYVCGQCGQGEQNKHKEALKEKETEAEKIIAKDCE